MALECWTGFLDKVMALVLLQWMTVGSSQRTLISCKVCLIDSTCVQHYVAAMNSALVVDKETEVCFWLIQEISDSPKKKDPPLVLFLSSTQPS